MIKVSVLGATGYVGIELVRILSHHPQVELIYVATQSYAGKSLKEVYPHLQSIRDMDCSTLNIAQIAKDSDVVFTALPFGVSSTLAKTIIDAGKVLIDLGADFRLKNPNSYKKWYGSFSASSELLNRATYAIPEIVGHEKIKKSQLIANPGCYPTCLALGAFPALLSGIVKEEDMIFDAKSGISGAGRKTSIESHFCEMTENFKAYAIGGAHRHVPEIEQTLENITKKPVTVQFTPHLIPMIRGLLVTGYFKLQKNISFDEIQKIYSNTYKDKPFVRLCLKLPETAHVRGSNYCNIGLQVDLRTQRLIVISVIDNLVKGAAGQAVQNMNIIFEQPETMGLNLCPTYP